MIGPAPHPGWVRTRTPQDGERFLQDERERHARARGQSAGQRWRSRARSTAVLLGLIAAVVVVFTVLALVIRLGQLVLQALG